ncbi:DUF2225 domain-containing protein [Clostridium thermarum]|uniref:DUF2225 domain-containing protein n=1 Tax=Clostridium thermarum TaxID=1716543 RepID=UPI001FABDD51|nr:DUF2225 domain-containing protein [Clostridium thermarum]
MGKEDNNKLFSGMEHLGFHDVANIQLYSKEVKNNKETDGKDAKEKTEKSLLYDKEVTCPVCNTKFKARAVKISAPRMVTKDSDFFIRYANINPYYYDVWLCNSCGYAAMKRDFEHIKEYNFQRIRENITSRWRGKNYPEFYDVDIAIERYKLSLLNYIAINAKDSSKAMNCLKIAWMYRLKEDSENEKAFLTQALEGLESAYFGEDFPIYGMDKFSTMYLIGELSRRIGNNKKAMLWFSKVITTPAVNQKLKELARDQKDLIKEAKVVSEQDVHDVNNINTTVENKKGFFKSLFKIK